MAQSELAQAMQIAAAMPRIQQEQIERVSALLKRMTISDLATLGNALEQTTVRDGRLFERIMKVMDLHVRVAEWHVDDEGRCQHKRYEVGNYKRARHGEIGDETWLEAWIA